MSMNRREFLQVMAVAAAGGMTLHSDFALAEKGAAKMYDLPKFGNVSLLHITDCHAQLLPIYFREPNVNLGFGDQFGKVPHLVGVKHAVNDHEFVTKCIARFGPEFRIFVGLEELSFPMMAVGACGLMNAVGNMLPKKVAKPADLVIEGKLEAAKKLHYELFEINQAIFFDTNPIPLKYMMKRLGLIPDNTHRLPMVPADKKLEERLEGVLKRAGLLKDKAA